MQEYDISIKGVSFKALIYLFREVFGKNDDRLSGDIAVGHPYAVNDGKSTPKTFSIHLRPDHKETGIVHNQTVTADKLDMLFEQAALKIVERFYPLEAAY